MIISTDEFNSEIFNKTMGNISYDNQFISSEDVRTLLREATSHAYDHLSIKIPTFDVVSTNSFLENDFMLVDTLLRYSIDLCHYAPRNGKDNSIVVCPFSESDIESIKMIAHQSFKDDRFHSDPSLNDDLCDTYYEKWAENSCFGFADTVLVAKIDDEVAGFITLKLYEADGYGQIVLNAVSEKYGGQGVYSAMLQQALIYFRKNPSIEKVIVGTQINVIPVQKAWINAGFAILDSYYVLQKKIR